MTKELHIRYVAEALRLWDSFGVALSRDGTLLIDGDFVFVVQGARLRLGPSAMFGPPPQSLWEVDYVVALREWHCGGDGMGRRKHCFWGHAWSSRTRRSSHSAFATPV